MILQSLQTDFAPPRQFPSPFNNQPHTLAKAAAEQLKKRLPAIAEHLHDFYTVDGGKMLGVLVVEKADGRLGYLSAFSGKLGGKWSVNGFVDPVFDQSTYQQLLEKSQLRFDAITQDLNALMAGDDYRQALSEHQRTMDETTEALLQDKNDRSKKKRKRHQQRAAHPQDTQLLLQLDSESRNDKRLSRKLQREVKSRRQKADELIKQFNTSRDLLVRRRQLFSAKMQRELFDQYLVAKYSGSSVPLRSLFAGKLPPGGAGDCAAVKLISAAIRSDLKPICLAEFWHGAASGLRQHGRYYPACRSKCRLILPYMLSGLVVTEPQYESIAPFASNEPALVYEDEHIVVVNKPAGMLSVAGHAISDCVEARLREKYPNTSNTSLLLHRLDQATSGLLLAAKDSQSYKNLQLQFQNRTVHKRYIACLSAMPGSSQGEINLPLRVDLEDRPRQLVCHQHGRSALTRYKILEATQSGCMVEFLPVTGRTHQLRVHAAHPSGLNAPIVGDELYGESAERLYLHAQTLAFRHPVTAEALSFSVEAPFYQEAE